jgi:hypothetical protein
LIPASRFPIGRSMSAAEQACKPWQPILGQAGCAISSPAACAKRDGAQVLAEDEGMSSETGSNPTIQNKDFLGSRDCVHRFEQPQ